MKVNFEQHDTYYIYLTASRYNGNYQDQRIRLVEIFKMDGQYSIGAAIYLSRIKRILQPVWLVSNERNDTFGVVKLIMLEFENYRQKSFYRLKSMRVAEKYPIILLAHTPQDIKISRTQLSMQDRITVICQYEFRFPLCFHYTKITHQSTRDVGKRA